MEQNKSSVIEPKEINIYELPGKKNNQNNHLTIA